MQLRRLLFLLLILPGLLGGSGWDLRLCRHQLLGLGKSCEAKVESSCCSREGFGARGPAAEAVDPCGNCCVVIPIPDEPPAVLGKQLAEEPARAAAVVPPFVLQAFVPRFVTLAAPRRSLPPAPPGRCTPLPLRI